MALDQTPVIKMFAAKMAGGVNDPDDLVVGAFKAFDEEGKLSNFLNICTQGLYVEELHFQNQTL